MRCPGLICGALASPIRYPGSVIGAELMAIKSDMDVCLPCGLINVCVFSDSLNVVRMMLTPLEEIGSLGVLALEIRYMLELANFISIQHMRRSANGATNFLARKAVFF